MQNYIPYLLEKFHLTGVLVPYDALFLCLHHNAIINYIKQGRPRQSSSKYLLCHQTCEICQTAFYHGSKLSSPWHVTHNIYSDLQHNSHPCMHILSTKKYECFSCYKLSLLIISLFAGMIKPVVNKWKREKNFNLTQEIHYRNISPVISKKVWSESNLTSKKHIINTDYGNVGLYLGMLLFTTSTKKFVTRLEMQQLN